MNDSWLDNAPKTESRPPKRHTPPPQVAPTSREAARRTRAKVVEKKVEESLPPAVEHVVIEQAEPPHEIDPQAAIHWDDRYWHRRR